VISPDQDWITRLLRKLGVALRKRGDALVDRADTREREAIKLRLPINSVVLCRCPRCNGRRRWLVVRMSSLDNSLMCEPEGSTPGLGMEFMASSVLVRVGYVPPGDPDNPRAW